MIADPLISLLVGLIIVALFVGIGVAGSRYFGAPAIFEKFIVGAGVLIAILLFLRVLLGMI